MNPVRLISCHKHPDQNTDNYLMIFQTEVLGPKEIQELASIVEADKVFFGYLKRITEKLNDLMEPVLNLDMGTFEALLQVDVGSLYARHTVVVHSEDWERFNILGAEMLEKGLYSGAARTEDFIAFCANQVASVLWGDKNDPTTVHVLDYLKDSIQE